MDIAHSDIKVAIVVADIAIVLIVGSMLVKLVRRFGQPPVIGEITAGILLGPSVLGLLPGNLTSVIFPADARPFLSMISQVGLLIFMFLVGWEFNGRLLRRGGLAVASVSLSAIALSFALGAGLATIIYQRHAIVGQERVPFTAFAVFLGVAMAITAFPVLARILNDSGLAGTPVGTLVIASAAVDDVIAWCLLAVVVAGVSAAGGAMLGSVVGLFLLYVVAMVVLVRPLLQWAVRRLVRDGTASPYLVPLIGAGVFLSSFATSWIGVHVIFGAFAFGMIMPREPREMLARRVHEPFDHGVRLLLPVFFIVTGLSVDLTAFGWTEVGELSLIIVAACVGKLVGAGIPAKLSGMNWRDAYSVGLLMNTRGLTELVILNIGVSLGVLDGRLFSMMVLMALITTAMAAPLLPRSLPRVPGTAFTITRDDPPAPAPALVSTARSA